MKKWFVDDCLDRRIERGTGVAQRENDRREERGIWAGHSKRIVGPPDSGSAQPADRTLYRVPTFDPSRPLISSLRRFLTLAPACWPRGKIPPHPSARSARHSSPQNGGPKGKMIEGRSGGSGRGTPRELWVPPDSGSAHRRIAGLYRVRRSTRSRSLRRPLISFPPPLPHPSLERNPTSHASGRPCLDFSKAVTHIISTPKDNS